MKTSKSFILLFVAAALALQTGRHAKETKDAPVSSPLWFNCHTRAFEGVGLKGSAEINRRLGDPTYPATPVVDEWLKSLFAK